jgi:hypothetical protein
MRKSMIVMGSALVMVVGAASAGELSKEGKVTGSYYGARTYKPIPMGKEAGVSGWEESEYTTGGRTD